MTDYRETGPMAAPARAAAVAAFAALAAVLPATAQESAPPDAGKPDVMLILDASGSMWGQIDGVAKITTAKQAIGATVADLAGQANLGLMAYGHRREGDCADVQVLARTGQNDPAALGALIEGLTPRGKTPIAASLAAAAEAFAPGDRQANVLLVSDGLETCGGDPCAAARALAGRGIETRVHVVGFDLTSEEEAALRCIAEEGGGSYFSASNATEFASAMTEAAATSVAVAPPPPPPPPEPQTTVYFEETFDGPAISETWRVENPDPALAILDGEGALFVAAVGETVYSKAEARNRYVLEEALPDGDFDIVAELRMSSQSYGEGAFVSLYRDPENQIVVGLYMQRGGCGTVPHLFLNNVIGGEDTVFDIRLFDGELADGFCRPPGRAAGDAVLAVMRDEGLVLRLQRRGRKLNAALEVRVPATEESEERVAVVETEAVTALRLAGEASFLLGQYRSANRGEGLFYMDRFALETVTE
ncbi:MAG: VWA domain-containing protein [Pseudomonadota bacterium]